MKKNIKKRTENDYLKSISNIVDLFYENRQLKRNINKAIEYIKGNLIQNDITNQDYQNKYKELLKILKGEK